MNEIQLHDIAMLQMLLAIDFRFRLSHLSTHTNKHNTDYRLLIIISFESYVATIERERERERIKKKKIYQFIR